MTDRDPAAQAGRETDARTSSADEGKAAKADALAPLLERVRARVVAALPSAGLVAVAMFGLLGLLVWFGGARVNAATVGLVVAAGALLLALHSLYRMVRVLAQPSVGLEFEHEGFLFAEGQRELREERRRLLRAINELSFDFQMGKLSESDYRDVRQGYELKAVEVMRAIESDPEVDAELVDELRDRGVFVPELGLAGKAATVVAVPVAGGRASGATAESVEADAPEASVPGPKSEPAQSAAAAEGASAKACGACGLGNDADARFCKHCGAGLT